MSRMQRGQSDEMNDDSELLYRVESKEGRFSVADHRGQVVVICSDAGNAEQYTVLLNQAFQRGYKAGYRAARRT